MKKCLSILLAAVMIISLFTILPFSANAMKEELAEDGADVELSESGGYDYSTFNQKLDQIRAEYPEGRVWTNSNSFPAGWYGCWAFANICANSIFGYPTPRNSWSIVNVANALPGDVITTGSHTMFIINVVGDTITVAEGNYAGKIHWGRTFNKYSEGFTVYHAPNWGNIIPWVDPTPQGHVMSESEGAGKTIPDGDYWIISKIAEDYFIDIPGNDFNTYNEQNVQTWRWDSGLPPIYDVFHFSYLNNGFYKIVQLNTNMAIDVYGAYLERGSNVSMWSYTGSVAQQWSIEKTDGGYKIRSRCNNYYMDIYDGKHENGTNILTWENNNGNNQLFSFIPYAPDEKPVSNGNYKIVSAVNDTCYLDIKGGPDFHNKDNIQIYNFPDEKFRIEYAGNSYYLVSEANSNFVMEVNNDGEYSYLSNSRNVIVYEKNNRKNQFWKIKKNSDGTYSFINKLSGYYLDLENSKTDSGTNVSQYQYNGDKNQKWKLRRVIDNEMVTVSNVILNSIDEAVNPQITVTVDNTTLKADTDYTVSIEADIEQGKGTATITGINDYCDTVTKEFKISVVSPTAPQEKVILGDADGDGDVTIIDATCIQKKLASLQVLSFNEQAANVDGDSVVTIIDATYIQKWLASLSVPYPIGQVTD